MATIASRVAESVVTKDNDGCQKRRGKLKQDGQPSRNAHFKKEGLHGVSDRRCSK